MKSGFQLALCVTWLCLMATPAHAGSVSLVYEGDNEVTAEGVVLATTGDSLTFAIVADFRDQPTLGGGFDVVFDPVVLAFDHIFWFDFWCKWHCDGGPGADDGFLESLSFASFSPIYGPVTVATMTFVYTGGIGTGGLIELGPTNGIGGPFVSAVDYVSLLDVDFVGAEVAYIPLPGAFALLVTALPMMAALRGASSSAVVRPAD